MRTLALWPRLLTGALLTAVAGVACANATPNADRSGEADAGGYSFADVSVRQDDEGTAHVSWRTSWDGETFPGVRACRWTVMDSNGEVVGQLSDNFVGLSSRGEAVSVGVVVEGAAASAAIECDNIRLDAGSPYEYTFKDIRPVPLDADGTGNWAIEYDAVWQGSGAPGPVTCTASFVDHDGVDVASHEVNVYAASGSVENGVITSAYGEGQPPPESAQLANCRPFA
jgi:hypothetical protein